MSEINTTAPTTPEGVEPIVKSGSSADYTTFDELEEVLKDDKPKNDKPKEPKEIEPEARKAKQPRGDDSEPEGKETTGKDKDSDGKEKESKESKDLKKQLKKIRAKLNDQDMELEPNTMVEVTIDGKKEYAPVSDIINDYSGRKVISRRFSEIGNKEKSLAEKEKEVQNQIKFVESGVKYAVEGFKTNPRASIQHLASMFGMDEHEAWKTLKTAMHGQFRELEQLSPEEVERRNAEEEREYWKEKASKYEREHAQKKQHETHEQIYAGIQTRLGITREQLVDYVKELTQYIPVEKLTRLTDEQAAQYVEDIHNFKLRDKTLAEVLKDFPQDEETEKLRTVLDEMWRKHPELNKEQLLELADSANPKRKLTQAVKEKLQQNDNNPRVQRTESGRQEAIFWDDIG